MTDGFGATAGYTHSRGTGEVRPRGKPCGHRLQSAESRYLGEGALRRRHRGEAYGSLIAQGQLTLLEIDRTEDGVEFALGARERSGSASIIRIDLDPVRIIGEHPVCIRGWVGRQTSVLQENCVARRRHPMMTDVVDIAADAQHAHPDRALQIAGRGPIRAQIVERSRTTGRLW